MASAILNEQLINFGGLRRRKSPLLANKIRTAKTPPLVEHLNPM